MYWYHYSIIKIENKATERSITSASLSAQALLPLGWHDVSLISYNSALVYRKPGKKTRALPEHKMLREAPTKSTCADCRQIFSLTRRFFAGIMEVDPVDYDGIGLRIRRFRLSQGMTQEDLAEKAAITTGCVSRIERAVDHVTLQTLSQVAEALDVPMEQIISGLEGPISYLPEAEALLSDCSQRECQILLDIAEAAKKSLRKYR
jgi:transcriptional regulator with XRE-family HTH domain